MNNKRQVVILCGGRGERLKPFTDVLPKPMMVTGGRPFLEHIIASFEKYGFNNFLLLLGYKSESIKEYFSNINKNISIKFSEGEIDWDTSYRIYKAKDLINEEIIITYSDNYTNININEYINKTENNQLNLLINKKENGNILLGDNNKVIKYLNKRSQELNYVEIGYIVVNKSLLFQNIRNTNENFNKVIERFVEKGIAKAIINKIKYYSISDPVRWKQADKFFNNKKFILLDRDGVINEKAKKGEYITEIRQIKYIKNFIEDLKILSIYGYKFIVITNQAGISRGIVTEEKVNKINNKIKEDLMQYGINIEKFYVCPHHWNQNCFCRKPKPGMLIDACSEYDISVENTIFIGDSNTDIDAAEAVGCKSILYKKQSVAWQIIRNNNDH